MNQIFHGKVKGNRIEFECDLGMDDGQEVEVMVVFKNTIGQWGEGIRRSAGAAAEIAEFDKVFEQLEQYRKSASYRDDAQ